MSIAIGIAKVVSLKANIHSSIGSRSVPVGRQAG